MERMKIKTRTRKLWKGLVSSEFLTKVPNLSGSGGCVEREDEWGVGMVGGL